jgi:chaperonin GroEL (HSP60 family)
VVGVAKSAVEDSAVLPGGGAPEIAISLASGELRLILSDTRT